MKVRKIGPLGARVSGAPPGCANVRYYINKTWVCGTRLTRLLFESQIHSRRKKPNCKASTVRLKSNLFTKSLNSLLKFCSLAEPVSVWVFKCTLEIFQLQHTLWRMVQSARCHWKELIYLWAATLQQGQEVPLVNIEELAQGPKTPRPISIK